MLRTSRRTSLLLVLVLCCAGLAACPADAGGDPDDSGLALEFAVLDVAKPEVTTPELPPADGAGDDADGPLDTADGADAPTDLAQADDGAVDTPLDDSSDVAQDAVPDLAQDIAEDALLDLPVDLPIELPVDISIDEATGCTGECVPDEVGVQTVPCGNCGMEMQSRTCGSDCTWGPWQSGACAGQGVCGAGQTDMQTVACGNCGTEMQTRTCDAATCTWNPWQSGTCAGQGVCGAGQTDMQTVPCGNCGTEMQTRTCDAATCMWNPWQSGACAGQGVCSPGAVDNGCDSNSAGIPTTCGERTCGNDCSWGACAPAAGAECLSGQGTNFQCCTPPGGGTGWQFCSASACTWFACEAHSCSN